jgi:hypothetical protein
MIQQTMTSVTAGNETAPADNMTVTAEDNATITANATNTGNETMPTETNETTLSETNETSGVNIKSPQLRRVPADLL